MSNLSLRRMVKSIRLACIVLILSMIVSQTKAQFYNGSQQSFGKNRVQYTDFLWTYFRFNNFDVYYYLNGKELAQHVADYAGKYIPDVEKKLETTLDKKTQFIVYNTYSELKQSNIGLITHSQYNTGGITHVIGTKVFLYFDGDLNHFDRQIRGGITRLLLENIIYGGSIGSQVKNSTLINLPSWYIDGMVSYYSRNWDTELDNKVKDGILSKKYKKFNHLLDDDAVLAGHSLWRYVAEKYGEENLASIAYMTRVNRSVESGFLYVLGISFKQVINDWYEWYKQIYTTGNAAYTPYNPDISFKLKKDRIYDNVHISPDGDKVVYSVNDKGLYKVYITDMATGKKRVIYRKGFRTDEKVDYSYPLLAWHPTGNIIAMIVEKKDLLYLYFYDVETKKWESQNIYGFQKILDFSYSPDGRSFVMSAVQRGQSDIYIFNIAAKSAEPLMMDVYNDLNPHFLAKSNQIIFSSNRLDDTIRFTKENLRSYDGMENNDLFIYDLNSGSKLLKRVTKTKLANETQPVSYSPGYFSYLSDANGIYNRYGAKFDSTVAYVDTTVHYRYYTQSFPLTNYSRSVLSQDISYTGQKTAELVFEKNKYHIYTGNIPAGKISPVENLEQSKYIQDLEAKDKKEKEEAAKLKTNPQPKVKHKRFVAVYEKDIPTNKADTSSVDINNYQISGNLQQGNNLLRRSSVLQPETAGGIIKLPQPRNYNVEYAVNQLVSQLDFSYLNLSYQPYLGYSGPTYQNSPTNALLMVGATDLLEDYRIIGGVRLNASLVHNEFLFGYSNLKHRVDREIYFHRTGFDVSYTNAYVRHRIHELHYVLTYPFTEVFALKGTATMQYDKPYVLAYDYPTANMNADANTWAIAKGELVYDNTREIGTNLLLGLRFKLFGEYYQMVNSPTKNMIVTGFDFRHYTRIHRSFIWANRFAGSTSFGKQKLLYYMGGVDNWLMPEFSTDYQIDDTQDYAFQTLATSMRGFRQNARSGNTFALFSSELRFPVFRYFLNKPLRSEFLNNFQVVGFTDIGSAWQGLNPLDETNTYYTRSVSSPPLDITVQVQKDPLIAGYGFGLRSTLFGYFLRADWAWGIEDQTVQPRIFYLSLSLDF
jgi:Tol biopolymer transport system component